MCAGLPKRAKPDAVPSVELQQAGANELDGFQDSDSYFDAVKSFRFLPSDARRVREAMDMAFKAGWAARAKYDGGAS
jgi:hypothetical protein